MELVEFAAPGPGEAAYELLDADSVAGYVQQRPALAARLARIDSVREVGDGNLNLVFIVRGTNADGAPDGLVVKQALPYVRADPSWPMTPARNLAEARALRVHGRLAPDTVPVLYDADPQRYAFTVEDLSDHRVWRSALNDGERHDAAAPALGRYVAEIAFGTSALGVPGEQLKPQVAAAINPALCRITELLVFTEPYTGAGRATVPAASRADVAAYADDPDVVTAIGAAKWAFMTRAEALIHGDLHTGSVMVRAAADGRAAATKAFDSEFAFYGPIGFDLGLLWGNLVLAAARSAVSGDADGARWRLAQPLAAWSAFEAAFRARWPERVEPEAFPDALLERLLARIREDALDALAAEAARRVIGPYPVSDIESLEDDLRARAVRAVLRACRLALLDGAAREDLTRAFDRIGDVLV